MRSRLLRDTGGSARPNHAWLTGAGVVPQSPVNHSQAQLSSATTCGMLCLWFRLLSGAGAARDECAEPRDGACSSLRLRLLRNRATPLPLLAICGLPPPLPPLLGPGP